MAYKCVDCHYERMSPVEFPCNTCVNNVIGGSDNFVTHSSELAPKPVPAPGSGVGDIHSDAKGSGARYNTGKPPLELIPLRMMAYHYRLGLRGMVVNRSAVSALAALGLWQERRGTLLDVLDAMGNPWHQCAHVFDYGRKKYTAWNWSKGMAWSIPMACAARHLEDMIVGITHDPESGYEHAGHVLCNWVMLATYADTFPEGDDRPPAGSLSPADEVQF